MGKSTYIYVSYIRTTPEALWAALTDPQFIRQYWFGMTCDSDFKAGSPWSLTAADGTRYDSGEILEADPPRRLVIRWRHELHHELTAEGDSRCTMELEPTDGAVKLSITHSVDREPSKFIAAVTGGWPKVISNLKSLLETGSIALGQAYPAGTSDAKARTA